MNSNTSNYQSRNSSTWAALAAILPLLRKEFLQIRRNPFMPKIILMFPIMVMCVMPWVMNQEVNNISVDVVDHDHTTLSQQLVQRIEASGYFLLNDQKESYSEALSDIERSLADIILEIKDSQYLIAANAVNGTKGAIASSYLSQIIMPASSNHHSQQPSTLVLYNKSQNYKVFMIPALIGILMMMLCGFLPALNIVGEKERGTIQQINVTPVAKSSFILAKLIPYWVIALLVLTVCLLLSSVIYGVTCQGSLPLVYLLAMLLALFFSSFGLFVSNSTQTMQQAMLVMWFFVVCLMLLSGLFTPTRSMPQWAYLTTYINPMHYFIDAIRTVFVRGGSIQAIAHQLIALTAIASIMGLCAMLSYRKNS